MLPPVLVSLWYDDGTAKLFLASAASLAGLYYALLVVFPADFSGLAQETGIPSFESNRILRTASCAVSVLRNARNCGVMIRPTLSSGYTSNSRA